MDIKIRAAQKKILGIFSDIPGSFALAGGTALELYYLHHRFSADLDFFSLKYTGAEIEKLVSGFRKKAKSRLKLESEFITPGKARIRFYTMPIKNSDRPLKIDFVEDVFLDKPVIKKFEGMPVYSVENIYLQKIVAITGTRLAEDDTGRIITQGRREARDVFDIYMLSRKIVPLHIFLKKQPGWIHRGIVHWYQTFSRQDLKLGLLDLDIYDAKFNAREMIAYLENEIKTFVGEALK